MEKIDWENISLEELAGFLASELNKHKIDTVLVGGACVTLYSHNRYQSYDLDFVTYEEMNKVKKVLKELGFLEHDRSFKHKKCKWFVEFVSPPVSVGNEPISKFKIIQTAFGSIRLLRPEDSVKDRLASYYHWGDRQGLNQAIDICCEQVIDLKEIEAWSEHEKHLQKFHEFVALLGKTDRTNH